MIIAEYNVIKGEALIDFITNVNQAIKEGWQPRGDMIVCEDNAKCYRYYQNMVKCENTEVTQPTTRAIKV